MEIIIEFVSLCRHHTYKKTGGKEIELSEIGPRFELKPYQIKLGTLDMKVWTSKQPLLNILSHALFPCRKPKQNGFCALTRTLQSEEKFCNRIDLFIIHVYATYSLADGTRGNTGQGAKTVSIVIYTRGPNMLDTTTCLNLDFIRLLCLFWTKQTTIHLQTMDIMLSRANRPPETV